MLNIITNNHNETMKLGEILSSYLTKKDVVILSGELGAGKTVFVRGVVKGFSGKDSLVRSPSYIYINTYNGGKKVHHIDFYLLDDYIQAVDTGFEELLGQNLCLIEWGNKFKQLSDSSFWNVEIKYMGLNKRKVLIKAPKDKNSLLKEIEKKWQY